MPILTDSILQLHQAKPQENLTGNQSEHAFQTQNQEFRVVSNKVSRYARTKMVHRCVLLSKKHSFVTVGQLPKQAQRFP